jgi:hypothetical protein
LGAVAAVVVACKGDDTEDVEGAAVVDSYTPCQLFYFERTGELQTISLNTTGKSNRGMSTYKNKLSDLAVSAEWISSIFRNASLSSQSDLDISPRSYFLTSYRTGQHEGGLGEAGRTRFLKSAHLVSHTDLRGGGRLGGGICFTPRPEKEAVFPSSESPGSW